GGLARLLDRGDARRHPRLPRTGVEGQAMTFHPVLHPVLLVLLCAPLAALIVVALVRPSTGSGNGRGLWVLRLAMLLVAFAMLLRPGIPGGTSQTLATDTDIVILVDTTASIVAEDWAEGAPRL